jgi:predicted nucleic acid-binding protein
VNVLVDTSIWSLALQHRRQGLTASDHALIGALADLVGYGRAQLIGPVRQEVLSGIREQAQFDRLREALRLYEETTLVINDFEEAARMSNECRRRGIAGSPVDFLLCAVAERHHWQIFTTDRDFEHYHRVLGLKLFPVPAQTPKRLP